MATKWSQLRGRVKDAVEASRSTMLLGTIQIHMMKEHSKPSDRRQDVVHPSEMAKTDWCPLSTFLRIKAARDANNPFLKPAENTSPQLLNIFDEGHMIHDKWQKRLKAMGKLWGKWYCQYCRETWYGNAFDEGQNDCWVQHHNLVIYREVPLKAEQYLISGHADGAVPHINSLIEIKSVGAGTVRIEAPEIYAKNSSGQMIDLQGLWKDIEKPFPSHVRQGQLYLALCRMMGYEYNRIIFIYEAKFNQGVKEFVVNYDPDFCNEMFAHCQSIVDALNGGEPPLCPNGSSCKECEKYGAPLSRPNTVELNEGSAQGSEAYRPSIRRSTGTTSGLVRRVRQGADDAS